VELRTLSKLKRYLVCGGRNYADAEMVAEALGSLRRKRGDFLLIHGDCPTGADHLADEWAKFVGINRIRCPADWVTPGKLGGFERNQLMLDLFSPIDGVVAFPGGPGTADMVSRAYADNIKVWQIEEKGG
jgi:hypothetical protein